MAKKRDTAIADGDSFEYATKREAGESASSFWTDRFGLHNESERAYHDETTGKKEDKEARRRRRYEVALQNIFRSANLIKNATVAGAERKLVCKWSDGASVNEPEKDIVYLSPDVLEADTSKRGEWNEGQRLDVLIGEALVFAAQKSTAATSAGKCIQDIARPDLEAARTTEYTEKLREWQANPEGEFPEMPPPSNEEAVHEIAGRAWNASEIRAAHDRVLNEFPGFKSYLQASVEYHTDSMAVEFLQGQIDSGHFDSRTVSDLMQWSMLHPDLTLDNVPDGLQEIVDEAVIQYQKCPTSQERAKASIDIADRFVKKYGVFAEIKNPGNLGEGSMRAIGGTVENTLDPGLGDMAVGEKCDTMHESKGAHGASLTGRIVVHKMKKNYNAKYDELRKRLRPGINNLKNRLKFRNELPHSVEHGLKTGRLDEGSLYKLGHFRLYQDNRIFEVEEIPEKKDVAFGLLVDESGSMGSGESSNSAIARDICITTAEALKMFEGVKLAVMGHTGQGSGQEGANSSGLLMHEYYTPDNNNIGAISAMRGFCQNLDGYAIQEICKRMLKWYYETPTKVVMHISDGQPAGGGYGGPPAMRHMRQVSYEAERRGIKVLGICVGGYFTPDSCNTMYGHGNWAIVKNMAQVPFVVSNIVARTVIAATKTY